MSSLDGLFVTYGSPPSAEALPAWGILPLGFGIAQLVIGQGLWNLREWARKGAIILYGVSPPFLFIALLGPFGYIVDRTLIFIMLGAVGVCGGIICYLATYKTVLQNFRFQDKEGVPIFEEEDMAAGSSISWPSVVTVAAVSVLVIVYFMSLETHLAKKATVGDLTSVRSELRGGIGKVHDELSALSKRLQTIEAALQSVATLAMIQPIREELGKLGEALSTLQGDLTKAQRDITDRGTDLRAFGGRLATVEQGINRVRERLTDEVRRLEEKIEKVTPYQ